MKKGELKVLRAYKFTILVRQNNEFFKLFKIIFNNNKRGGFSIIVSFPYFLKKNGILSKLMFPANTHQVAKLSLEESGSLSSHLVKYSHWEDGKTHFSQEGKVFTSIRNNSVPLNVEAGHIFSIQLQGMEDFEKKPNLIKKNSIKDIEIDYALQNPAEALKFTGWWLTSEGMVQNIKIGGPQMQIRLKNGEYKQGFALMPANPKYNNCFLFLSAEIMSTLDKTTGSVLSFIGGFEKNKKFSEDTSFLSFIYPVSDFESMKNKMPSIDFS